MEEVFKKILLKIDSDAKIKNLCVGLFGTAVQSVSSGFAYNFERHAKKDHDGLTDAGDYVGKSAKAIADLVFSKNLLESSVGVATINSLIVAKGDNLNAVELIKRNIFDKTISVVGHFPFVDRFKSIAKQMFCFELDPQGEDLCASEFKHHAKRSDLIVITGSTFVGHTLLDLLNECHGKEVYVVGPTTIMSDVMFDYGVSCLCGVKVEDIDLSYRSICEGGNFRTLKGVKQVVMTSPKFSCSI